MSLESPRPGPPAEPLATEREHRAERVVFLAFATTMATGLALLVLYVLGGQPQLEGILLALCLGGLGVGIVVWTQELMPTRIHTEPRSVRPSRAVISDVLLEETGFTRRRLLIAMFLGALGGLGSALAIPIFSLGPAPGRSLFETSWRSGLRLVGTDGTPIRADDLPEDSLTTVFPEGHVDEADAQAILIRVPPGELDLPPDRAAWAPDGFVCYSKLCTHAGCPVGLYRAVQRDLICPCHQSTFDVLRGAVPTFGPAVRPLPQLPIRRDESGGFVALGDFPEAVGPSFWDMRL